MLNRTLFYKSALNILYFSGAYHALKNRFNGVGVLLTLHHVRPDGISKRFSPNRILSITPEFLEASILQITQLGYEIVSLDEFQRRLVQQDFKTRFVCFTLDDGYADNYTHAFPVFRRHQAPFAIYLCTGLLDGSLDLWWQTLEDIIREQQNISIILHGVETEYETLTTGQKYQAYESIYWSLRRMPLNEQTETFQAIRKRYGDSKAADTASKLSLTWDMITEMQQSGLVTVGAHTLNHHALSKMPAEQVQDEMARSRDLIEQHTGIRTTHFAYPYGDAHSAASREFRLAGDIGFQTGVTTRKGVIFPEHAGHLAALPRVSLNGDYQRLRYIKLFLSGLPFALSNKMRRLDVA